MPKALAPNAVSDARPHTGSIPTPFAIPCGRAGMGEASAAATPAAPPTTYYPPSTLTAAIRTHDTVLAVAHQWPPPAHERDDGGDDGESNDHGAGGRCDSRNGNGGGSNGCNGDGNGSFAQKQQPQHPHQLPQRPHYSFCSGRRESNQSDCAPNYDGPSLVSTGFSRAGNRVSRGFTLAGTPIEDGHIDNGAYNRAPPQLHNSCCNNGSGRHRSPPTSYRQPQQSRTQPQQPHKQLHQHNSRNSMGQTTPPIKGKFPGYLSSSLGVMFADVLNGMTAISKVPSFGCVQVLTYALYCEVFDRIVTGPTLQHMKEFYKSISKEYLDPLAYMHFNAEGEIEFKSILYLPKKALIDTMDNYWSKKFEVKLFIHCIFVIEKFDELLPRYLSFVRGVIDSDDLPLNVSCEQLQQNKIMKDRISFQNTKVDTNLLICLRVVEQ